MFISATQPAGAVADQPLAALVASLRAAGEPTRLRVLALLQQGELSVTELASALGQSQPRVSRHLKLLADAGLIERGQEGAWVFCRLPPENTAGRALADAVISMLDPADPAFEPDQQRLKDVRAARDAAALAYFDRNAGEWGRVRALHLPESAIEEAMLSAAGEGPFDLMVDVGAGAGRMLAVFAPRVRRAIGFDVSVAMLAVARAELDDLAAGKVELRLGDAYAPPVAPGVADLVTVHQVLHFLSDPARAVAEAARLLRPGGLLLIADFAPHRQEFLRDEHAHRRLGFSEEEVAAWCAAAGAPVREVRELQPQHKGETLTVRLWVAERLALRQEERAT